MSHVKFSFEILNVEVITYAGKAFGYGLDGLSSIPDVEGVEIFLQSVSNWSWGPLNLLNN